MVDAWYAGAAAASSGRLVTRNAISLVFPLPVSYENRIRGVEGVTAVVRSNWFGGIYRDPKNFFASFAVSDNYLDLYPEFIIRRSSAPTTIATAAAASSVASSRRSSASRSAT